MTSNKLGAIVLSAVVFGANAAEPDVADVARLKSNFQHRLFTSRFQDGAFSIYDADEGRLEGSIPAGYVANLAVAPDHSQFLVAETYWSHGSRGKRDDLIAIWDAQTLELKREIPLPSRALIGDKIQTFQLNSDGSRAFVYVFNPASAVAWVDLKKQALGGVIEIPGCASIYPFGTAGFSSLCVDGSLATVDLSGKGKPKLTHTAAFFDAATDPVFDNGYVDAAAGKALFLSYTGLVYEAELGSAPTIELPWSIQQAAGFAPAGTGVQELAWRPGGAQVFAYQKSTGRLFVLMHVGTHWTHKQGGTEVWVLDSRKRALLARFPLQNIPTSGLASEHAPYYCGIAVSSDAENPQIYLVADAGGGAVMDANSGAILRKIESAGGKTVLVAGN